MNKFNVYVTLFCLVQLTIHSCKPNYSKHLISQSELIAYNKTEVLRSIKIKKQNMDSVLLMPEIRKTNTEIVLRVPRFTCLSCVNREMAVLDKWIRNNNQDSGIVILDYSEHRFFSALAKSFEDKKVKVYNSYDFIKGLDKVKKPYFMHFDKNGKIRNVFLIEKQEADASLLFLKSIYN